MRTTKNTERDLAILERYVRGGNVEELKAEFRISTQRIAQIIRDSFYKHFSLKMHKRIEATRQNRNIGLLPTLRVCRGLVLNSLQGVRNRTRKTAK